jgi:2-C-methyl-D-erythritol 4-phosphate cytidylyltransferase
MRVSAIVLVAGKGIRFKNDVPKPLAQIYSQPVVIYCLKTLSTHPDISDILVVVNSKNKADIINTINRYRIGKIKDIVLGGSRRQDSVSNGLRAIDARSDFVLIHDGVRPFIDKKLVSALINAAKESGAAIAGVPVKVTIKKIKNKKSLVVEKTLDRNSLWEIQTPQVFKKDLFLEAYDRFGNIDVTDDAMLVEKLGAKVKVVLGSYDNIKITTAEDLAIAEAISKKWNTEPV